MGILELSFNYCKVFKRDIKKNDIKTHSKLQILRAVKCSQLSFNFRSFIMTFTIDTRTRVLARIPKLAVQKFFWEWPNISVGMVALKVFWDVATETVAIKHMCWSDKAIIVFLNSGFKLLTSVLYARIVIMVHKHGEFMYAQISHIQAYLTCF